MEPTLETTEEIKKNGWQLIPRKIIGGIAAMGLVWKAAVELKDAPKEMQFLTIICMSALGAMAIWTHYLLERGPKKEAKKNIVIQNPTTVKTIP
jgi:hypothetical protein